MCIYIIKYISLFFTTHMYEYYNIICIYKRVIITVYTALHTYMRYMYTRRAYIHITIMQSPASMSPIVQLLQHHHILYIIMCYTCICIRQIHGVHLSSSLGNTVLRFLMDAYKYRICVHDPGVTHAYTRTYTRI